MMQTKRSRLKQLLTNKLKKSSKFLLSQGQRALWFLYQSQPDSAAYNTAFCGRIHSAIDVTALERCFQILLDRHPMLRTQFFYEKGEVQQEIQSEQKLSFEQVDCPQMSDKNLQQQVDQAYQRPFDLFKGPMMRVTLFSRSATDHVLLLSIHHIVCDAWSIWILLNEFNQIYPLVLQGKKIQLPFPSGNFEQYTQWQQDLLSSSQGQELSQFWWQQFAVDVPVLQLPNDRESQEKTLSPPSSYSFRLQKDLMERLKKFAQTEGLTLFVCLLGAFNILLHRYSGQKRITIGTPTTGRSQTEFENTVGYFVNPIPLMTDFSADPSCRELLHQIRSTLLAGLEHQDYPLPRIIQDLNPLREVGQTPLFQTLFVMQKPQQGGDLHDLMQLKEDGGRVNFAGLELEAFPLNQMEGQFDLTLEFSDKEHEAIAKIKYNTNLFDADRIQRMGDHFQNLLQNLLDHFESPISQIPLMDEKEREQLVELWNDTEKNYPLDKTLHHWIEEQVEKTPDRIALQFNQQQLSYDALNRHANLRAYQLQELGVVPDQPVGIFMDRSLEMVIGLLAILKAGGAYLPLDPEFPASRLQAMLDDSGCSIIVTNSRLQAQLPPHQAQLFLLDEDCLQGLPEKRDNPQVPLTAENLAYIIYTSGSTGTPKGVMNTHQGICNRLLWMQEAYQLGAEDRVLQKTPYSFDVSVWEFFWPLMVGARLVMAQPGGHKDAQYLVDVIQASKITTLHFVPSMLQLFLEQPDLKRCDSIRRVICSGEALPYDLQQRFFERLPTQLHNLYGPTEAAVDVTFWQCQPDSPYSLVPIGVPIANTQIYILDKQQQPVPVGIAGELHIGGLGLARGYLKRPELTREKFITNPLDSTGKTKLYKTGDLARYLPDGNLEYLGRLDNQIKIRGFRVELGEIEAVLTQHESIQEAVVSVQNQGQANAQLTAYLVSQEGHEQMQAVQDFARQQLPVYMLPSDYHYLEKLPLTSNGKVNRKALLSQVSKRVIPIATMQAELSTVEQQLQEIWKQVLGIAEVPRNTPFFELGGHSILMGQVQILIQEQWGKKVSMIDLFSHPTIHTLAQWMTPNSIQALPEVKTKSCNSQEPIAIIGMACRFPGAENVRQFWDNLQQGVESIAFFSQEELQNAGVPSHLSGNPNYVPAYGALENIDAFDAKFFGFTAREAEILDPQHRLFFETAWTALEDGGYPVEPPGKKIGVFAGVGINGYLLHNLSRRDDIIQNQGAYSIMLGNDKDFLPTRTSYKLNLTGPSMSVQTACSTSLVAVHQACRSLQNGECNLALAGGVSIMPNQKSGYLYQEGMIFSPDGHCRPFDAKAQGMVGGSGVGVILLKPLSAALKDQDSIHAVIKGSAINNDGAQKVGFSAPNPAGQLQVIKAAQAAADIDPASIGYIETHGTGTLLGDQIEIEALNLAFQGADIAAQSCLIGSVKSNFGHLDAASGIAGLIKTTLALKHKIIPASLHFQQAKPELKLEQSPFRVNQSLQPWPQSQTPCRAAVSSFGIGGTNAHLILEESPQAPQGESPQEAQLLLLSAQSEKGLQQQIENLHQYLRQNPETNLSNLAYTLAKGRVAFPHRYSTIGKDTQEFCKQLQTAISSPSTITTHDTAREIAFMFPGQGNQFPGMAEELYQKEEQFKQTVDHCASLLQPNLRVDLRELLYGKQGSAMERHQALQKTEYTQPALFVIEYALAKLWISWGIQPKIMIGHSIGEYVAACLAGVFSLEDALHLVTKRAQLMAGVPQGSMLALPLKEEELRPHLTADISLAAINAPKNSVVAGETEVILDLQKRLSQQGIEGILLKTSHAFHSPMMDNILEDFRDELSQVSLHAPKIPYLSNLTGKEIKPQEATDPDYWVRHLRGTVRFADGLQCLQQNPHLFLLEVGPGHSLSSMAQRILGPQAAKRVMPSLPHAQQQTSAREILKKSLGQLWQNGFAINWSAFYGTGSYGRISLPTYPFARKKYWIDPPTQSDTQAAALDAETQKLEFKDWFSVPTWKRAITPLLPERTKADKNVWLLFEDNLGTGEQLTQELLSRDQTVISVFRGGFFRELRTSKYQIDPSNPQDYRQLIVHLKDRGLLPQKIVHLWNLEPRETQRLTAKNFDQSQEQGLYSLLYLSQALAPHNMHNLVECFLVTSGLQLVVGESETSPLKAPLLGALSGIPWEMPAFKWMSMDFLLPSRKDQLQTQLIQPLLKEILNSDGIPQVAYRGGFRWIQEFAHLTPVPASTPSLLRQQAVYLITGGMGGMGFEIARFLAKKYQARLVLTGRSQFPDREQWPSLLQSKSSDKAISRKIQEFLDWENAGAAVMILSADVADAQAMDQVAEQVKKHFGKIHGIIHAAGSPGGGLIAATQQEDWEKVMRAKTKGALVLEKLTDRFSSDFLLFCSSITALLGGVGQTDYAAANFFLDQLAQKRTHQGKITISVNWDTWSEVGMAKEAEVPLQWQQQHQENLRLGITNEEGIRVLAQILQNPLPQVVVSTRNLQQRLFEQHSLTAGTADTAETVTASFHQRPTLDSAYQAAKTDVEIEIIRIWQELLGIHPIGILDNFFDLGGDSLLATQMLARLRGSWNLPLELSLLFECPTTESLALWIEEKQLEQYQTETPIFLEEILNEMGQLSDREIEEQLRQGEKQHE